MRILLVSLHFVEYSVELANALSEKNQVFLILSEKGVSDTIGEKSDELIDKKVSYTLLPDYSARNPLFLKNIFSILQIFIRFKPDIIHVQECWNWLILFFLIIGRTVKPMLTTVHDVQLHPSQESSAKKPWRLRLIWAVRKYAYKKIIVHGEFLKKQYMDIYTRKEEDVFVVPHGSLFTFTTDSKDGTSEEPETVLFFGRIEEYKGLKYLVNAEPEVSKYFPKFKIIIAGRGADLEIYKPRLASNRHFEIHDNFIPNDQVSRFFQRASIVVLPYIEASQSGVVAMAYAFGKTVIVTDTGSLAEMVEHNVTGIVVPPADANALAEAIVNLLRDSKKRLMMSGNAAKVSNTKFGWRNIAALSHDVYCKII